MPEKGRMIVQEKLLKECVEIDLARFVLKGEDAEDWERWHNQIKVKIANPSLQVRGIKTCPRYCFYRFKLTEKNTCGFDFVKCT